MKLIQFLRRASLQIGDRTISPELLTDQLRVVFTIDKTQSSDAANKSTIEVYNLSKTTRDDYIEKGLPIILKVGYASSSALEVIFKGVITDFAHQFKPPEVVTKIKCGDGTVQLKKAMISVALTDKNSNTLTAIKLVIDAMSKKLGEEVVLDDWTQLTPNLYKQMTIGWNHNGSAKAALDELTKSDNLVWSYQNGVIRLLRLGQYVPQDIEVISEETGMIGIPDRFGEINKKKQDNSSTTDDKDGFLVKTLIKPKVEPGVTVKIISKKLNLKEDGEYSVTDVKHTGDTHGTPWMSKIKVTM